MSESAEELYSKRGKVILGSDHGTLIENRYRTIINGTRIDSVVEAGKSYIITFNSNDPEWANMSLYIAPEGIRTPLQQLNSTTYIVKFTATGTETGIGIYNSGAGKGLSYTNYTLYEYQNQIKYPDNVLRPFIADQMYYRNQEVQKLYLGSRLLWELVTDDSIIIDTLGYNILLPTIWGVQPQINSVVDNYSQIDRIVIYLNDGTETILRDIVRDGSSDIRANSVTGRTGFVSARDIKEVVMHL